MFCTIVILECFSMSVDKIIFMLYNIFSLECTKLSTVGPNSIIIKHHITCKTGAAGVPAYVSYFILP